MEHNAGEIVELAVRRQNVNISELSKRLNVNRRTLYNWFKQRKLHTDVILEIGKAIHYDFSIDFEGELQPLNFAEGINVNSRDLSSAHSESVYYWMEKYITLLEDYKRLVRKESSERMLT